MVTDQEIKMRGYGVRMKLWHARRLREFFPEKNLSLAMRRLIEAEYERRTQTKDPTEVGSI